MQIHAGQLILIPHLGRRRPSKRMKVDPSQPTLPVLMGEALYFLIRVYRFDAQCSGTDGSLRFVGKVDPTGTGENSEFVDMNITTNGNNVSDNPGDIHKCLIFCIRYASPLHKLKRYPSQLNYLLG